VFGYTHSKGIKSNLRTITSTGLLPNLVPSPVDALLLFQSTHSCEKVSRWIEDRILLYMLRTGGHM
jgi:hypothetical protein